jgi:hypothetical protein
MAKRPEPHVPGCPCASLGRRMHLSDWQPRAPHRDSMVAKVVTPATEALELLGAGRDPDCWIVWGDDPAVRYTILAPAPAGLVIVNVRVNVPGEGPRASGKIVRWQRVQIGELSVEIQGGHRLITFQIESQLLHGADDEADAVAAFVDLIFATIDGRRASIPDTIALPGPAVPTAPATPASGGLRDLG